MKTDYMTWPMHAIVQIITKNKAHKINNAVKKYVHGKVLDVGSGRGYIAKEIETKNHGVEVTCIDINDYNKTDLKLIIYDGKKIPFSDNSFDTVMLNYVLHHVDNPEEMIMECKRVCKGNILIIEDSAESILVKPIDYMYNRLHGVYCPFNFKTDIDWIILFNKLGLDIIGIKRGVEKQWFCPIEHILFVLKKRR